MCQSHSPHPRIDNKNRADNGVLVFWKRGRDCLFDVFKRVLAKCKKEKKRQKSQTVLEQRKYFVLVVSSVDGISAREAKSAERRLAY